MDKNKEKTIRCIIEELIGKDNLDKVDEYFAPEIIAHARGKKYSGYSFIKRFAQQRCTSLEQ